MQRLGFFSLALLLRPNIPLPRLFNEEERGTRTWGPPPLKVLAAECLNHKLLRALESLSVTKPAPGASSSAAAALPNLGAQTAEVTNSEAQSAVVTAGAAAAAAASSGGETSAPRMPRPPQLDTTIAITTPFSSSSSLLVPVTPPSAPLTATRSAPWLSPFLIHQANSPGPAPGVTQAGAISEPQLPPGCSQPGEDSGNSRVGHTGDHILTGPATPQPQLPQGYMSTHQSTIHLSEEGAPEVSPGHQAAAGPHDPAVGTLTAAAAGTSTRGTHSNRGVQPAAYAGPSTTASLPAPAPGLSPSLSRAVTLAPHCGVPAIAVMARGSSITLSTAPRGSIPTTLQAGLDISPAPALDAVAGMVEETPVEQHRQHRAGSGCMPGLWEEGGAVHMHSHHRVQAAAAAGASGAPASPPVQWVAAQHCSSANAAAVTDGGDDAVEECGVCLEEDAFIQLLPCQHHLCKICSQKIFAARGASRCPFCRALVGDVCARQH
jgi:type II secretory pathway pseudopilin PulG